MGSSAAKAKAALKRRNELIGKALASDPLPERMRFTDFCSYVGLQLTPGQRVLSLIAFDGVSPTVLDGEERELARALFGGIEDVPESARRIVVVLLGRGSGKTTLAAAYGLYQLLFGDISGAGPGDVPVFCVVSPDRKTATLSVRMALELARRQARISELLEHGSEQSWDANFTLRRLDGRLVAFEVFAAARGGRTVRGRSILGFILDEAWFFTSDEGGSYVVSDRDVYRALIPRLMKHGKGVFLSTPWPVETLMGELFERNFGSPHTALAAKAPTELMVRGRRDAEELLGIVALEKERDPDNAAREYDCDVTVGGGGTYFDSAAIHASAYEHPMPVPFVGHWEYAAAADFGFRSDSSALAVCGYDGTRYHLVQLVEKRPTKQQALVPSVVVGAFAEEAKRYGRAHLVADGHYREAVHEHLRENGVAIDDAPAGLKGKLETYARARAVLHEGKCVLPKDQRFISQLRSVTSKPTPGGGLTITIPRRAGGGHGDLVSAWVLATWKLAYARVAPPTPVGPAYGTREYEVAEWEKQRDALMKREARRWGRRKEDEWPE